MLKIKAVYDTLKSAERRAVDFLLNFPDKAATFSVTRYAPFRIRERAKPW